MGAAEVRLGWAGVVSWSGVIVIEHFERLHGRRFGVRIFWSLEECGDGIALCVYRGVPLEEMSAATPSVDIVANTKLNVVRL